MYIFNWVLKLEINNKNKKECLKPSSKAKVVVFNFSFLINILNILLQRFRKLRTELLQNLICWFWFERRKSWVGILQEMCTAAFKKRCCYILLTARQNIQSVWHVNLGCFHLLLHPVENFPIHHSQSRLKRVI